MIFNPNSDEYYKVKNIWEALAYRLRNEKDLDIVRIDASKNDVPGLDLTEFPAVAYYDKKKHHLYKDSEDMTLNGFLRFLRKNYGELVYDSEELWVRMACIHGKSFFKILTCKEEIKNFMYYNFKNVKFVGNCRLKGDKLIFKNFFSHYFLKCIKW